MRSRVKADDQLWLAQFAGDVYRRSLQDRELAELFARGAALVPVPGSARTGLQRFHCGSGYPLLLLSRAALTACSKTFVVKRFAQELHCPLTHGMNPHLGVTMRSDEDDRYSASLGLKVRLQFKTGHARHANIGNQARSLTSSFGIQELFRGAEATCGQAV